MLSRPYSNAGYVPWEGGGGGVEANFLHLAGLLQTNETVLNFDLFSSQWSCPGPAPLAVSVSTSGAAAHGGQEYGDFYDNSGYDGRGPVTHKTAMPEMDDSKWESVPLEAPGASQYPEYLYDENQKPPPVNPPPGASQYPEYLYDETPKPLKVNLPPGR